MALKRAGRITSYYNLVENHHGHTLGGWPLFCQPGTGFSPACAFVLQIASDAKVQLHIVDNGPLFLAKNAAAGEWKCHCDFY